MTEVIVQPKDSFSLVLSSDTTDFRINYSPPIELKKERKYEVALVNLETYYTFPNVNSTNNIFRFSVDKGSSWKEFWISEGSYELHQLNSEIFRVMKLLGYYDTKNDKSYITISANLATLKCIIQIDNPNYRIDFSHPRSLSFLLGYDKVIISDSYNEGSNTVNILSVNSVLVECSIIEGSYLNSSKASIIYSFFPDCLPGQKIIEKPKNLVYLPVIYKTINDINIKLKDNNQNLLNLRGEIVTIRLHLREA